MSILGHGVDIVIISEFASFLKMDSIGKSSRCFSAREAMNAPEGQHRIETLAGKFAAKEAVSKALGTGIGAGISMCDIEILREPGSPPAIHLKGAAKDMSDSLGILSWHLSISHSGDYAMASAIASS